MYFCLSLALQCCSENCLHQFTFEEAEPIFHEWNVSRVKKLEKLRDYLSARKVEHNTLYSKIIAGASYLLTIVTDCKVHKICPNALRKLFHIGIRLPIASPLLNLRERHSSACDGV